METRAATKLTADDYFALSVEGDRKQLVGGAIVVNEPTLLHQLVQLNLVTELTNWTRAAPGRGIAFPPIDVIVDEHNVYGPDVVWLREERVPQPIRGRLEGLPDLAVEIRSPGTWRYDVGTKKHSYERARLPELWLVDDRAATVLVFRRSAARAKRFDVELELTGGDRLESPMLPGFGVPVERLFTR